MVRQNLPPLLAKFAALGTNGQHPNNMHKELLHLLEQNVHVPQPLMVKLPFAKGDFLQSIMLPTSFLPTCTSSTLQPSRDSFFHKELVNSKNFGKLLRCTHAWRGMRYSTDQTLIHAVCPFTSMATLVQSLEKGRCGVR